MSQFAGLLPLLDAIESAYAGDEVIEPRTRLLRQHSARRAAGTAHPDLDRKTVEILREIEGAVSSAAPFNKGE